jgi:ATP-dependent RNA helicase HelY
MSTGNIHYRSPRANRRRRRRSPFSRSFCERPRIDPQLRRTFDRIGVPEPTPFRPDPFQLESLEKIEEWDVLVSAPTGSGKTWIATQAISRNLSRGRKSWYASPLKALSNAIYQEFCENFGSEVCGILTGDRKENPNAPIVVGTTEILRNQLYDAMHEGVSIETDLVILDEAHYLSDPERGVVWEEVLIYLPARVRLLLLSATISNADEIAAWLRENRKTRTWVVRSDERPVPLEMLFLFPDGLISPLTNRRGLSPKVKKFELSQKERSGFRRLNFGEIIACLREVDLLPAIFFLKSRMDCDRALLTCSRSDKPEEVREHLGSEVREFLKKYPHLEGHRQTGALLEAMVGSHHAGQLPYWKVLIEKMMVRGYLEAIFSTSTVAAGVNFPARTVVLVQSDRFNGHEFSNLTATELHQMTGRAGRRGKDNIGFALVIPGQHQDPQLIAELKDSPPEPLMSRIHINFSMSLNLLLSHRPDEIRDLLNRSYASYQESRQRSPFQARWNTFEVELKRLLRAAKCDTDDPTEILENILRRSQLRRQAKKASREDRAEKKRKALEEYLRPGTLFLHKNRQVYVVFRTYSEKGRRVCAAHNLRRTLRFKKGQWRLKRVDVRQIRSILDYRVEIQEEDPPEKLKAMLAAAPLGELKALRIQVPAKTESESEKEAQALPCEECLHQSLCHGNERGELQKLLREFESLVDKRAGVGEGLWLSFKKHLRFLKETGFVDSRDRLTQDGLWASKLRLDHPLLIAEAIRRGAFSEASPEVLAGCLAPFVWDRVVEMEYRIESPVELGGVETAFRRTLERIEDLARLQTIRGFKSPKILFWPCAALFLWASGVPWRKLLTVIEVDEGDLTSLIARTADHLRQVANLAETHPDVSSVAAKAIDLILREPVLIE